MAAEPQLSAAAVTSEECVHTRVTAVSVQERTGATFVASLDPVNRTRPPDDDCDGTAAVSGGLAPSPSVECNGHQSSDPSVPTHVTNEANRTIGQVDSLPSVKVVQQVTSASAVEAARPEAGCDDDAAKVFSVPSDLVDCSRTDQAAANARATAIHPLSAEAASRQENCSRNPGVKRLFDSFVDVVSIDDSTVLKWPRDMVYHTVAQPSVAYSCNPLHFDFRASRTFGVGLVPSIAAVDRDGAVRQLIDELVTAICGELVDVCIADAALVCPPGRNRSLAGSASSDEPLVTDCSRLSTTGGDCERQPFAAKLACRVTARRQYRWKNRSKRTTGHTSAADGVQKDMRASGASAAAGVGEEQSPCGGEAVQKDKRKQKKKKRKKKKKDRRHTRSRSSLKNASDAADDKSQIGSDSALRGGSRHEKRDKAAVASSCATHSGDTKLCANGAAVHEVKRKSRKHKSKSKRHGKHLSAFRTPEADPDGKAAAEQARDATRDPETGATEDKAGTRLPSPPAGYRGANGSGDRIDLHAADMPAVEMDVQPCASDLKVKERKPRNKSAVSGVPVADVHTTLATEQGGLSASLLPAALSTVAAAAALPAALSAANATATQAAFPVTATVATCISPATVSACHQVPGESALSSGRLQSSDHSPLQKRSAGAQVATTVACERMTAVQSPVVSDRGPPKKIKIAFKAAPRGGRGGTSVEPFVVSKWDSSDGESESESERRRLRLQSVLRLADPADSNAATTLSESIAVGAASVQLHSASLPESSSVVSELACNVPRDGPTNKPGSCHERPGQQVAPAASCIVRSPASKAVPVADECSGVSASHPPALAESITSKAERECTVDCRGLAVPSGRMPGRDESRRAAGERATLQSRSKSRSDSRSRSRRRRGTSSAARSNVSRSSRSNTDSRSPSRSRRGGHRHRRRRSRSYSLSAGSSSSSRERSRTRSRHSRSTRSASSDAGGSRRRRRHRPRHRTRSSSTERSRSRRSSSRSRSRSRDRSCSSRSRSRSRSWSRRHRRRRHRRHRSSSSWYSRSHSHSRTVTRSRSRSRHRSRSIRRPSGRRSSSGRAVSAAFAATKKSQLLPTATRQPTLVRGLARPAAANKKPTALPAQLIKPPMVSAMAASSHQLQRPSLESALHAAASGNSTEYGMSSGIVAVASSSTPSAPQGSAVGHTDTIVSLQLSIEQRAVSGSSADGRALGMDADEVANSHTGTSLSTQCTSSSMTATGLIGPAAMCAAHPFIGPLRPGERQDAPGGEGYDIPLPTEQQPTVLQSGSGERMQPSSSGASADAVVSEPVAELEVLPCDAMPSEPVPMQLPPEQAEQYRGLQEQAELYRELREQQQRMQEALAQGRSAVVAVGDDVSHHADQLPPPHEAVVQSYAQQMIMAQRKPSFALPPMAAASPPLSVPLLSPAIAIHQQAAKAAAAAAVHALPAAGGIPLQAGSPVLLAGPSPAAAAAAFHAQVVALQQQQQHHHQQLQQQQQLAAHIQAQMHHMQAAANAAAVGGLPLHLSGHHPGFAQPAAVGGSLLHGLGVHQLHGLPIGGLGASPGSAAALALSAGGLPQLVGPAHPVLTPNAQQLMHIGPQLVHLPFGSAMAAGGGGGSGPPVVMIQGAPHVLLPSRLHRGL